MFGNLYRLAIRFAKTLWFFIFSPFRVLNFDLSNGCAETKAPKVFARLFRVAKQSRKGWRGRGRGALVARRNERKLKAAFLFCKAFFFVPLMAKKKASETLVLTSNRGIVRQKDIDAFFDTAGAKKALQRNAVFLGLCPNPRKLLKKLDQNFHSLVWA